MNFVLNITQLTQSPIFRRLFFIGVILSLWQFLEIFEIVTVSTDVFAIFIPFFSLFSNGCSSSGGGGGSCAGGGGGGGGGTSTPYLYIKKNNGAYEMQNDVMVGTPSTYMQSKKEGENLYKKGALGADIYPISLQDVDVTKDIQLQLKEIEQEESFIYSLRGHFYTLQKDHILLQDWTHQNLYSVKPADLQPIKSTILLNDKIDCTKKLNLPKQHSHNDEKLHSVHLKKGDTLTFEFVGVARFISISSFWRDWATGMEPEVIHRLVSKKQTTFIKSPFVRLLSKISAVAAVLGGLFFGGAPQNSTVNDDSTLSFIEKCNCVNIAQADFPSYSCGGGGKSLNIAYMHPSLNTWVSFATIQPRVYRPTDVIVELPAEAYDSTGKVKIQIEATKQHYVKGIHTIAHDVKKVEPITSQTIEGIVRPTQTYKKTPVRAREDKPLHLIAGDTFSFTAKNVNHEYTHMAIELRGFYMPLSETEEKRAGDWKSRLNGHEKAIIESIYSS